MWCWFNDCAICALCNSCSGINEWSGKRSVSWIVAPIRFLDNLGRKDCLILQRSNSTENDLINANLFSQWPLRKQMVKISLFSFFHRRNSKVDDSFDAKISILSCINTVWRILPQFYCWFAWSTRVSSDQIYILMHKLLSENRRRIPRHLHQASQPPAHQRSDGKYHRQI
jgi:hypothetical protein